MLRLRQEVVIERIGSAVFLDEEDLGGALDDFYQSGDHWMAQFGQDVDFSLQVLYLVGFVQTPFFVDFYCYFLVASLAKTHLHNSIGSLS